MTGRARSSPGEPLLGGPSLRWAGLGGAGVAPRMAGRPAWAPQPLQLGVCSGRRAEVRPLHGRPRSGPAREKGSLAAPSLPREASWAGPPPPAPLPGSAFCAHSAGPASPHIPTEHTRGAGDTGLGTGHESQAPGTPSQALPSRRPPGGPSSGGEGQRGAWSPGSADGLPCGGRSGPVFQAPSWEERQACPPAPLLPRDRPAGLAGCGSGSRPRAGLLLARPGGLLRPPGALRAWPATGGEGDRRRSSEQQPVRAPSARP